MKVGISITEIVLKDGRSIELNEGSIILVTGPNNVGKSTLLFDIERYFRRHGGTNFKGIVLDSAGYKVQGKFEDLMILAKDEGYFDEEDETVSVTGGRYKSETLKNAFDKSDLPKAVQSLFVDNIDPRQRLWSGYRGDAVEDAADLLFFDETAEVKISDVFRKAFGVDMILHRERRGGVFHLGDRSKIPSHKKRLTPQFRKQMESLPQVMDQGAGMRSFARIALQLMTSWKTVTLIDEPELFLHPPQVRHLARLVKNSLQDDRQAIIATHSEAFVKGVIDYSDENVVVVRLQRSKNNKTRSSVLSSDDIKALWSDPLLRTSNVLSALFHDVAVLMEGETDVRFMQSLMDSQFGSEHLPDVEYYSCNGKSKIFQIAKALRGVNVPVVAVLDIDILQNTSELVRLYQILGGNVDDIKLDAEIVKSAVETDRNFMTGRQLVAEIEVTTSVLQPKGPVPDAAVNQIREILKKSSPWTRVKHDGFRGITDSSAINAFNRLNERCQAIGILINTEGELEGFCRTISRSNKSEWLNQVLRRDIVNDKDLNDARIFAERLKIVLESAI